ncbi:hypothetical protein WG66_016795 [Moniliophthora roreri]|nr:hypothetical protein WG66_016795 [Moniliophthora roreri]
MNIKKFDTNEKKILLLLSYVKGKAIQAWKDSQTMRILDLAKKGQVPLWKDFLVEFKKAFEPIDTARDAQMRLRDMRMKDRANKYAFKFKVLVDKINYDNVVKSEIFQAGLSMSLVMKLACPGT